MLWLSLHLPELPLQIHSRGEMDPARPLAVIEGNGTRQTIHACNQAAAERGISPGMRLGAAIPLLGEGRLLPRRPDLEQAALGHLADWAGQFTSTLSLLPPNALLLEIGGSLTLFHGLTRLRRHILDGLAELGYQAHCGIAPTPLGAWLLAQQNATIPVSDHAALETGLTRLPLEALQLPSTALATLKGMGLRYLGDCLRLPTAGLSRRLGPELLTYLYKVLGRLPDPRPRYASPDSFASRLLLPSEVENTEALLFAARRLIQELAGFLRSRGLGVQQLSVQLFHPTHPPSDLAIGLLSPSRDMEHLMRLLKTRLEPFRLPAPVQEIGLLVHTFQPLPDSETRLFNEGSKDSEKEGHLLERLQARLGTEAISGQQVVADHRPEHAWRRCAPGTQDASPGLTPRPLFLLAEPEPLQERNGHPYREGRLHLLLGPERIETGWWDGHPVRRDYFIATDQEHSRWWVFRDLQAGHWYLHGIFA